MMFLYDSNLYSQLNVFICRPISGAWDIQTYPHGCMKLTDLQISQSVFNIITDIILFLMPLPIIIAAKMRRRDRSKLHIRISFPKFGAAD